MKLDYTIWVIVVVTAIGFIWPIFSYVALVISIGFAMYGLYMSHKLTKSLQRDIEERDAIRERALRENTIRIQSMGRIVRSPRKDTQPEPMREESREEPKKPEIHNILDRIELL